MTAIETIEQISTQINKLPLVDSEVVEIITQLNNPPVEPNCRVH